MLNYTQILHFKDALASPYKEMSENILLVDGTLMVNSDWTCRRQIDSVKHDALGLEHMLVNQSIHTGRAAL